MNTTKVYFDLETGGLEPHHPIIQLAAVAMLNGEEIGKFEVKLGFNPDDCDREALLLNGYNPELWGKYAVPPRDACQLFVHWLKPYCVIEKLSKRSGKPYKVAQLAGYNAASFDAPRLQKLFKDCEEFLPADYKVLDVMQLVMWFLEASQAGRLESIKLSNVCEHFLVKLDNAHDALADARATAQVAHIIQSRLVILGNEIAAGEPA